MQRRLTPTRARPEMKVHLYVAGEHALRRSVAAWHAVPSGSDCIHQVGLACVYIAVIEWRALSQGRLSGPILYSAKHSTLAAVIDQRKR